MCNHCIGWHTPYVIKNENDLDTGVEVNIGNGEKLVVNCLNIYHFYGIKGDKLWYLAKM